jgi:hypothetical protein
MRSGHEEVEKTIQEVTLGLIPKLGKGEFNLCDEEGMKG